MNIQVTSANLPEVIQDLEKVREALPKSDHSFTDSLIKQFKQRNTLSEKQMLWVGKMLLKGLTGGQQPLFPGEEKPGCKVETFQAVFDLFNKATGAKLKSPRLVFVHKESNTKMMLIVAGPKSSNPGALNIKRGPADSPYIDWVGRMMLDGSCQWRAEVSTERREKIVRFLTKLGKDTHKTISEYGHMTGFCCFCNSGLTDEKSLKAGYGPVCAKNWGLPWGK